MIWTCATCGIEHPDTDVPARSCAICEDERQFVPQSGQRWTTQAELIAAGHRTRLEPMETDLYALTVEPEMAIGQRGLLLRTPGGNLLWEPPGLIDDAAVEAVRQLGGVSVITASHPHLTGASIQWSHAFDHAPVLVASADQQWIRRPDDAISQWDGVQEILPGLTMIQCGGHFAGSSVIHWAGGAEGRGALLVGDTIAIGADRKSVSVMRSYVNRIPLPERAIRRILSAVDGLAYDRLYGAFGIIDHGAKPIVNTSLQRYIDWLRGDVPDEPEA